MPRCEVSRHTGAGFALSRRHFPAMRPSHCRQVHPRPADRQVRDVPAPAHVRHLSREHAPHQVRRRWHAPVRGRRAHRTPQVPAGQPAFAYQPGDALVVDHTVPLPQLPGDPWDAVGAVRLLMDLLDPRVRSLADAITSALANPAYRRNAKHMAQ